MTTDRRLNCLGGFKLKAGRFEPKYVDKLTHEFYFQNALEGENL